MAAQVTLSEIARKAKVSPAAVSCVLLGTGAGRIRVSQKTSDKIRDIASKLHYVPNQAAQQLAGKQSNLIGVLLSPEPIEINFIRLAAIERRARQLGYRVIVGFESLDSKMLMAYTDDLVSRTVQGVICMHHTFPEDATSIPTMLMERVEHVVFIDQPAVEGANFVGPDFAAGVMAMVMHLQQRGRKKIALVINELAWYSGPRIHAGYLKAIRQSPAPLRDELIWIRSQRLSTDELPKGANALDGPATARRIVQDLVIRHGADAIVASDDMRAAEIIHALHDAGKRVPEDVAVAGIGSYAISRLVRPRITTLDLQLTEVGELTVDALVGLLKKDEPPKQVRHFVIPQIVVGESS